MPRSRLLSVLILALTVTCCGGASSDRSKIDRDRKVGGCVIDTIPLGLYMERSTEGIVPDRITLKSVYDGGRDRLGAAAIELTAALDSLGVQVLGRSELLHIVKGACWPAFSITIEVDLVSKQASQRLLDALSAGSLCGMEPSPERGEDYGTFFVTAGRGSSDWWTLWYRE